MKGLVEVQVDGLPMEAVAERLEWALVSEQVSLVLEDPSAMAVEEGLCLLVQVALQEGAQTLTSLAAAVA